MLGPLPVAGAAVPDWSGLDARYYNGSIPPQGGTLITQVPLDPTLSVAGAGAAYRLRSARRVMCGSAYAHDGRMWKHRLRWPAMRTVRDVTVSNLPKCPLPGTGWSGCFG